MSFTLTEPATCCGQLMLPAAVAEL